MNQMPSRFILLRYLIGMSVYFVVKSQMTGYHTTAKQESANAGHAWEK